MRICHGLKATTSSPGSAACRYSAVSAAASSGRAAPPDCPAPPPRRPPGPTPSATRACRSAVRIGRGARLPFRAGTSNRPRPSSACCSNTARTPSGSPGREHGGTVPAQQHQRGQPPAIARGKKALSGQNASSRSPSAYAVSGRSWFRKIADGVALIQLESAPAGHANHASNAPRSSEDRAEPAYELGQRVMVVLRPDVLEDIGGSQRATCPHSVS